MKKYIFILCAFALISCKENYTPKPYGFFRINLPEKSYTLFQDNMPYYFKIASVAEVEPDNSEDAEPYWINIVYPQYNAKINLSYKPILTDTSLAFFQHDCHRLAYAHTIKADAINERFFERENGVYGLLYLMEGNSASPAQFFVTDSVKHFLRGALYFNERPHNDSLAPVIEYIRKDIEVLMESVSFN